MAALVEQISPLHHRRLEVIYGVTDVSHQKLTQTTHKLFLFGGGHGTAWAAFETGGGDKVVIRWIYWGIFLS
jgi:hypothetical protein